MDTRLALGIARQDVRTQDASERMWDVVDAVNDVVTDRFVMNHRRLSPGGLAAMMAEVDRIAASRRPLAFEAASRPPTKGRPKSGSYERRFIFMVADDDGGVRLKGLTIYAGPRRVRVETINFGVGFYLHAAARTMEREGIVWSPAALPGSVEPARAIGIAMVEQSGLLGAMLLGARMEAPADVALPFSGGLLLGTILRNPPHHHGHKVSYEPGARLVNNIDHHPVLGPAGVMPEFSVSIGLRTYVDQLFESQEDLARRYACFHEKHPEACAVLRRRLFWPGAEMAPADPEDIQVKILAACREARNLVCLTTELREEGLGRRPEYPSGEVQEPVLGM